MNFPDVLMDEQDAVDFGFVGSDSLLSSNSLFGALPIFFAVVVVLFVAIIGFGIFVFVRNYRTSKKAGLDPFTLQTDLAARAANSQMLAPKQSREQRLEELHGLLTRNVITREEYDQARLKILTEN